MTIKVKSSYTKEKNRRRNPKKILRDPGKPGVSNVHKLIAELDGGPYYTVQEIADMCGVTLKTVKQWINTHKIAGSSYPQSEVGAVIVNLYTTEDARRFRRFAHSQRQNFPWRYPDEKNT